MTEPTPAPSVVADAHRIVSDVEAEIKGLAQELHDKIVALGGESWITDLSENLKYARQDVENAANWIKAHFDKVRDAL